MYVPDGGALLAAAFAKWNLPPARLAACAVVFLFAFLVVHHLWRPLTAAIGGVLLPLGESALTAYVTLGVFIASALWLSPRAYDRLYERLIYKNEYDGTQRFAQIIREVEETGESAMLMWWKDGHMSGVLGYKGHIYTIENMGDAVHAVVEVDPKKMPPDHAPPSADSRERYAAHAVIAASLAAYAVVRGYGGEETAGGV